MQWPNQDGNECHKPIEDVEVGDYVLAYNEDTGESDWKPVVRLFRNETKEWYHIHAAGEEIICTPNHPFYVIGKGFVEAKDLKGFEILLKSNGVQVSIDSIEIEELEEAETTYNFEVADFHTYYVTENNILVHNDCKGNDYNELYRGDKFKVREKDVDMDIYTKIIDTSSGISVSSDINTLGNFKSVLRVDSLPKGLTVIQKGLKWHYEIVPEHKMLFSEYVELIKSITFTVIR